MEKQLRKNVLFNTIGSVLFYLCQFLQNFLVVWLSGLDNAGVLSLAMSISAVCVSFANYGMRSYQVSDFAHRYSDATYRNSRLATVGLSALACTVFCLANSYTGLQRAVLLIYTLGRLIQEAWVDVWHGYLQRGERMDLVGINQGVRGLLGLAAFVAVLYLTGNLLWTVTAMTAVTALYVFCVDIPMARPHADFGAAEGGTLHALLWECAPLALYAFLNSAVGTVPKYFCERLLGNTALAYFNCVFSPVQILQVGVTYMFVPFITVFAHWWADKNGPAFRKGLQRLLGALAVLWVCGALGCLLVGRWGLMLLYGARYGEEILAYAGLLQPLVIATVFTCLVMMLCHLLTVMRQMPALILGNVGGILVSCVASPLLLGRFGVYGAAYATILASAVQGCLLLGFVLRGCKKQFADAPPPEAGEKK